MSELGYVVWSDTDEYGRVRVTQCADCTDDDADIVGVVEDDRHWDDEDVPYPECYNCDEVIRP